MIYIGIDPGLGGAVAVKDGDSVSVFDAPTVKNKKSGKYDYDIAAMADILRPYHGKNVTIVIENVFSMKGQGTTSMFNFGRGKGLWEGIAWAFQFDVHMVIPLTWKKTYAELAPPPREKKQKGTKAKVKVVKTENEKKEAAKQKRLAKALAKENARKLAARLFPQLADKFKLVNDDGRAEAVLIANYAEKTFSESKA